ncbi:unnamed protein product [Caenorhabditis angaria]|uniref:T20D4.11-like domain-containing protein n=1 Tax=Caenorhabditis angaria TaxID=860376 RepID=A0A9P1J3T7_9PELO|nr:unnamed protein product [Caenorhabditis angaria]
MRQFLVILSIFFIYACIAYKLPTTTEDPKVYNCSLEKGNEYAFSILSFEMSFLFALLLKNATMISTSCEQFENAISNSTCELVDSEKKMELSNICAKAIYELKDFSDCSKILKKDNSTCYQNDLKNPVTLIKKKKANMTDAYYCNNVFGEGNCLRKLIIDKCGEKQWQGYKTAYSTADPFCDFSQL